MKLSLVFELKDTNLHFVKPGSRRAKVANLNVELPYLPFIGMRFAIPPAIGEDSICGEVYEVLHDLNDGITEICLRTPSPDTDCLVLGPDLTLRDEWELEDFEE